MSFADEYMALRAKRLAEIKETGKVQETPVEHTAPAGGGAVSDFGARYMALRQKRIADGYKTLTVPPDLGGRGPKAPFAIGLDPFGRKPVVEQIRKNDPQGEKYRAYYKTYNSGGADMLGLSQKISQDTKRIAELERELADDQYTLDNWPGVQPGHTPSKEMLDEQAVVWKRMERNRMELAGLRKESPEREEEYAAYWAFSFSDMQNSDESNRKGYAMVGNNLRGDVGEVYRTLMYNEEPTRRDLEKSTVESVKINGNTLDMGKLARMTEEEKALFFYLCNMGETQKAEALLHEISGYLAQRYSDDIAEATDIPVLREAIALATSAGKGVKNIGYGFASMFADLDAPEISEGERMQTYWQEKHRGTLAGYTTGAASTIGNVIPAIAGHAINPVVGSMATFFNTRGNAYAEAKRDGANHEQAWLYSTLTGAAETGLQTLLGRAGGLIGGKIPGAAKDFVSKFASKISSNKFGKLMLDWVIDVGSEEIEENLQSFLDPAFKMFANIGDHYEAPTWEEIAETTIVTAISSTIFFGVNQRQESRNAKWQSEYTAQVKETMEAWEKLQTGEPFYEASQALRRHFAENEDISPVEFRDILLKYGAENAPDSEGTDPNWEQYEQEHEGERFQYDPTSEKVDQLEDMRGWREDTYEQAQSYTDRELTQAIEEKRAIRDDKSQDNKSRAIAQHHLDALEYTQMQRQNNNAALNEQRVEGVKYSGAEGLNDSGQRSAGVGARGSVGGLEESTGRSIPRGQGKTEKAIVEDIRGNAAAQSARGIGIIGGSESADLRVIPAERIGESESWSRIRDEVEARGQKLVLVVGKLETVDPVTKKVYTHEGIRQVNADGTVTYYIKADKITRNTEQIYKHEDFHDIVHNNPEILGDLVLALEMEYGRQEILGMVNRYVEAFDGIYGRIEDTMTEEQEHALIMVYMEEVFADVYGDIRRGNIGTASAQKIMRDQTDQVQRASQNRSATDSKTAPPEQKFSIEKVVEGEKGMYENCVVLDTDLFNHTNPRRWGKVLGDFVYKNLAGQKLTMFDENGNAETVEVARTNDRVRKTGAKNSHKVIDELARYHGDNIKALATVHLSELLAASDRESRSDEKNHQWMDEKGWIYRHVYIVNRDGVIYDALLNIADGRDRRIIYEINNIRAIDKRKGTAHGVVPSTETGRGSHIKSSSFGDSLSENVEDVKQNFSVDDEVAELDEEYARKITEGEEPRRGKTEPEWEAVRGSMDDYNATAKDLKEQRAEKNSITVLKNRITKNEQMLRELSNMRTMAKKSNFLSMNMDKEIERRRGIIQETLEIDRAALKAKQEAKKQEDKSRKKKEQEEEIRQVKAQKATEDMVTEVMDLFFTKKGVRYEVREMLRELADQTVKDGRITDEIRDELLRVLYENSEVIIEPDGSSKDIRKFVQYAKIYVPEDVRTAFGEHWEGFRNKAFGNRMYLTANSNDMNIASVVESLNEVFGYVISDEVTPKAQLEGILDLTEEGKAEKISLPEMMERNREEGWSVEDQMDEMERRLDQILLTFSEKAGFEIDIKQKTLRKMNKQREEFRRTLERQRDRAMENELMNQVRKRAQRLKAYYKRATPSIRRMIDEQIGDLDTLARSISQKGLEDIQQIIDSYNQTAAELGDAFIANPEIVARLERVKQRHLDDMTVEEVRTLGEALTGIIQQIQNYNKMASAERSLLITDMANRAQKEIVESEGTKKTGHLRKFMMGQLNAKVFFGKISGYADGAWKWISDQLNHGEEMERQYQQRAMALFDPFLSDKKNQEWLKKASGKNAVWETLSVKGSIVLEDGAAVGSVDSIELTPMMKVSLLMHSKNDDNLRHIGYYEKSGDVYGLMGGGVTIPDKALYKKGDMKEAYARGQVLVIPPDVVRAIAKNCTEQEKAFAALLTKYFDGMAKSAINEVSLQVDGWERAVVMNYFPIQSDKAFIVSENGLLVQDMSLLGSPFLKERSHKGKNPMFLFDATDVLYRNIEQVSKYYGLTRPLRDLHAVMNATYYQTERKTVDTTSENELLRKVKEQEGWGKVSVGSVEKALISKWGHDAKAYIERLSAHLQGAKSEGSVLDDWLTGLRGRYARSVISFNPSSVAKQVSSYFVAYSYLDAGDLSKGLFTTKYLGNIKEAVMNLSKYSAVYWYRNQGNVNAEIREYTERKGTLERLPLGFQWTQMMDSAVTRRLLAACMHHVSKEMGLKPGSQESIDAGTDRYWSEVAKLFNKVVLDTQSNTSTMERPDIVRGDKNSVAKFITMFRTDAFQQHNLQVEARGMRRAAKKAYEANQTEANKKRLKAANKHLAKTTAAVFMGQLTVGLITSLLAYLTYRDKEYYDEEGEFSWKKFFGDVAVNTAEGYAGMILGLDWISSLVESKITEEKWYGPEVLGLESVKTFGEDVTAFFDAAVALDFQEGKKQLRKLAKSAGFVFGVPVSNIEKYLLMATRWFAPEFAERWENIWDETEKDDLQHRSHRVMEEAISVILDNRVDNLSDEDKAEIARLYIAGGTGAVPSAIPTSFSYTNEDGEEVTVTLSPKQKEKYREVWNEYATAGLADILASEQYESADDKGKTMYIDKLYKFAGQMAKNAVEPKKEPEKWVQQGLDAQNNGVSLGEYVIFRIDLTGISGKNEKGETVDGLQMQRSMELLEAMGWTDKQEKEIYLDVLAEEDPKKKALTDALTEAGISWEIVNDIVTVPGGKKEKFVMIAEAKISDNLKVKAMSVFAEAKEQKMLSVGLEYGVKPEWYAEVLMNGNADGKGIITQTEAKEYIDGMGLSLQEKTILFQMITDMKVVSIKEKDKSEYPYWYNYGVEFWYAVHEDDPE